jgi:hypothetical protein
MPYEGLLFNKNRKHSLCYIYLDKGIVNTPQRKNYIFNHFIPKIQAFKRNWNRFKGFWNALH